MAMADLANRYVMSSTWVVAKKEGRDADSGDLLNGH